jgi:hypothetical protein
LQISRRDVRALAAASLRLALDLLLPAFAFKIARRKRVNLE